MKIEGFISQSFIFAIAHSYNVIWRKFNTRLRKNGCSISEALVLIAIYFEDHQQSSPSKLGSALRTSRTNISHCLAKLQRLKLIRRTICETDARRLLVSLTPAGSKLAQKLIVEIEQIEAYCESHLMSPEQGKLLKMLYALGSDLSTQSQEKKKTHTATSLISSSFTNLYSVTSSYN